MIRGALATMLLLVAATPARDVNSVRRALEARYQHARTLRASFFERYTDGNGGALAESGTVYFSRPGRMRWEYESPEQKLFIVDGTNVWFYIPADHTASRAKLKDSSDWRTPLALLTGKADLSSLRNWRCPLATRFCYACRETFRAPMRHFRCYLRRIRMPSLFAC